MGASGPIDRASAEDLVSLVTDVGPSPMHLGAVLSLAGPRLERESAVAALAERIRSVPRLRQRLIGTPLGCGRPVWVDDPDSDPTDQIAWLDCPAPGDEDALLSLAVEVVTSPLPRDRPLWRAAFVDGLDGGGTALIVAVHHVLADGIGGLAVLGSLVDGASAPSATPFPRPAPSTRDLARDVARERIHRLRGGSRVIGASIRSTLAMLRVPRAAAPALSINRPTGPRRQLAVVRRDLAVTHDAARIHGVTVNDLVLTAFGAALGRVLDQQGEQVDHLVMSMPVAERQQTTTADLGNRIEVAPVVVPAYGSNAQRLHEVAGASRLAKRVASPASSALVHGAFRLLAALGLFRPVVGRQRLVNTFVTNLRGPSDRISLLDRPLMDVVAVSPISGNVGVAAAVLSYAGTLVVTLIADPDVCPHIGVLRRAFVDEVDALVRLGQDAEATQPADTVPAPIDPIRRSHHARRRRLRIHVREHPPGR